MTVSLHPLFILQVSKKNRAKERYTYMEKPSKLNTLFAKRVQPFFGKIENSRLFSKFGKKTWWIIAIVSMLVIGGGVTYFQMNSADTQTTTADTLQTTIARKGDLVIYASGTGTLVAMEEVNLGFKTSGQVKEINVEVGDKVAQAMCLQ